MIFISNIVVLQSCPGSHITFYRLKKISLFGSDPCNNHTRIILIFFFNENKNEDLKIVISSCIAIHIAIAILVQIIAITYFFKIVQPYFSASPMTLNNRLRCKRTKFNQEINK